MQNLDFGPTHKTGGAKHKINDFCFLKFFISMKFDPYQAKKMIFHQFEQCGISLRLKFQSTSHLTHSNMSKLILHSSNWQKIIFWAW